jgi:hypothetical protein
LGTSYPAIARSVRELCLREPLREPKAKLAIDATGVGVACLDIFKEANINADIYGVTIHGGNEAIHHGRNLRIPKRELVSVVQANLQRDRLKFAAGLAQLSTLITELQNFHVTISESGHDTYDGRSGIHDDLILALSIGVYLAQHPKEEWKMY